MVELHIAQDDHADDVISTHPFGLLVGMLLDQSHPPFINVPLRVHS